MGDCSFDRDPGRNDLERAGGRNAGIGRNLRLSSGRIWPPNFWPPHGISLHLAVHREWAVGNRVGLRRVREVLALRTERPEYSPDFPHRGPRRHCQYYVALPQDYSHWKDHRELVDWHAAHHGRRDHHGCPPF